MRDFLAWLLLLSVIGTWLVMPWRSEPILRLFNAGSDEELMRRFGENRRFLASIGLVIVMDIVAIALALVVLF
jgi:hypothetical protein